MRGRRKQRGAGDEGRRQCLHYSRRGKKFLLEGDGEADYHSYLKAFPANLRIAEMIPAGNTSVGNRPAGNCNRSSYL